MRTERRAKFLDPRPAILAPYKKTGDQSAAGFIYSYALPALLHEVFMGAIAGCGQIKSGHGRMIVMFLFFANLLTEHGGVVPGHAQFRVRCKTTQSAEGFRATGVVIKKYITLFALNECQHVDVLVAHWGGLLTRLRHEVAGVRSAT